MYILTQPVRIGKYLIFVLCLNTTVSVFIIVFYKKAIEKTRSDFILQQNKDVGTCHKTARILQFLAYILRHFCFHLAFYNKFRGSQYFYNLNVTYFYVCINDFSYIFCVYNQL